jgi:D-glycero-D-manno-heptose 1,7-bisphosphate phosphatase
MRAVILDRDGVINHDSASYIKSPDEWRPIAGSIEAIAQLHKAGYSAVVISNQSGIARGLLDAATLDAIHAKLIQALARLGAKPAGIYVCPHAPEDHCDCRKPKPGLFLRTARELGFSLAETWAIGDSMRDLEAARAAGAKPVLVRTGNGRETERLLAPGSTIPVYDNLATAAAALLHG